MAGGPLASQSPGALVNGSLFLGQPQTNWTRISGNQGSYHHALQVICHTPSLRTTVLRQPQWFQGARSSTTWQITIRGTFPGKEKLLLMRLRNFLLLFSEKFQIITSWKCSVRTVVRAGFIWPLVLLPSWYTSLLNLLGGYNFIFCWKLVIIYHISEILNLSVLFFSRLLFMDVAAGLKILELIIPTPQLWVPQVFAAFMAIFHNFRLVGHLLIENNIFM